MSGAEELAYLTISELTDRLDKRDVSAAEVTRLMLERIEHYEERLNAFITLTADAALAEAEAVDAQRQNGAGGPLLGVPIVLKDLYATAGVRTTAASQVLAGWAPEEDSTVTRRLREAGTVMLGKTNMMEFAYGYPHPDYGETANPWALERTAGGSSGGSAGAVIAGLAYAGMGSDTGGSIRSPASYTSLVGLKATYGRISRAGVVPLSWSLDHAGPLTRTVRDTAVIFDAIAGYDPADPASAHMPFEPTANALEAGDTSKRIAVIDDLFERYVQPEVREVALSAVGQLRNLGYAVESVRVPDVALVEPSIMTILQAEATSYHWNTLRDAPETFGPAIRENLYLGATVLAKDYLDAQRVRRRLHDQVEALLDEFDALVFPTQPTVAPQLDAYKISDVADDSVLGAEIGHTGWANLTGHPAVSVPGGFTPAGLPVGIQFTGKLFDELTILQMAHRYEQSADWHQRRPDLASTAPSS